MTTQVAKEFERARHGILTHLTYDTLGPCFICGDYHIRQDVDDYVYHESVGIVCTKHHNVKQWYNKLLASAQTTLRAEGTLL